MTRSRLLTVTAVIGIFVGALGFGAAASRALASGTPATVATAAGPAQAAPTPTATCPFLNADGTRDLDAMHAYVDSIHGEGFFEQMWGRMAGNANGVTPGTGAGYGPGTGICPLGLGTGPGTGIAPQDGTGLRYGPGAAGRGGMMGAGFGFGANR